jgi:hypothetical protein
LSAMCPSHHSNVDGSAFCSTCGVPLATEANEPVSVSPNYETDPVSDDPTAKPQGKFSSLWGRLSPRSKVLIPVVAGLVVAGVIVTAVLLPRAPHVPTEADYRHAFEDVVAVVIANDGVWESPAPYPSALSGDSEELFGEFKKILLDPQCEKLSEGEEAAEFKVDLEVALAKDNGFSVDFTLAMSKAVLEAAAEYICPQYSAVAGEVSDYIDVLTFLR